MANTDARFRAEPEQYAHRDVIADAMTENPVHAHIPPESALEIVTVDAKRENHAQWLTVNAKAIADADARRASPAPWPVLYAHWDVTAGATMASPVHAKERHALRDVIADAMKESPAHVNMPPGSALEIVTVDAKMVNHVPVQSILVYAERDVNVDVTKAAYVH